MWFTLWVYLIVRTTSIITRNDLSNALYLYKNRIKNVNNLKAILSKTDSNIYRKDLDKIILDARNSYSIPESQLSIGSRIFYSILSLPSYIELANQILIKSDAMIEIATKTQSNALMESLPDTHAKRIELLVDAKNSFDQIKAKLTNGLLFSSVISRHLISLSTKSLKSNENWNYLHKKACFNQLVAIMKSVLNSILNRFIIPMILATICNILRRLNVMN